MSSNNKNKTVSNKPIQRVSFSKKIANKKEWWRDTMDYYIGLASFNYNKDNTRNLHELYAIFNGEFPKEWFRAVLNPLNSKDPSLKNFPAKIRSLNMLRPNLDLLAGELSRRPHDFQVVVKGEEAYNNYTEALNKELMSSLKQMFINKAKEMQAAQQESPASQQEGVQPVDVQGEQAEVEIPEKIKATFLSSYKDNLSIQGQGALEYLKSSVNMSREINRMFKDWLITGEVYSYKEVRDEEIEYNRVSPMEIDFDKSPDTVLIEDGEWVVRRQNVTFSDLVDKFHDVLTEEELTALEEGTRSGMTSATGFKLFDINHSLQNEGDDKYGKFYLYHVVWKSQRKIGILSYLDEMGQVQQTMVEEGYSPDKEAGESVKWEWINDILEGYQVEDIYLDMQPLKTQRNAMSNFSKTKLPYNGRKFSDTHTTNKSVLEMGLHYLIMYIILNYRLELAIAKSNGKIVLMDINTIPKTDGMSPEKFFYYAQSMGYMLINRNQVGVDKSFNQYQVLDTDLFQHISGLIDLMQFYKQEWDDVLGITRQRKGQAMASDQVGTTERAVFQSSVISDLLFETFEDFLTSDQQGLLDYSKFAWVDGKKSMYMGNDAKTQLLNIIPDDFIHADLGVFATSASEDQQILAQMKQTAQAYAQNGAKASSVLTILEAKNIAKVKQDLAVIEQREQEMAQQNAKSEEEAQQQSLQITQEHEKFLSMLEVDKMQQEQDRLDNREYIKGELENQLEQTKQGLDDDYDVVGIEKNSTERTKNMDTASLKRRELDIKAEGIRSKERIENKKADVALKNKVVGEK